MNQQPQRPPAAGNSVVRRESDCQSAPETTGRGEAQPLGPETNDKGISLSFGPRVRADSDVPTLLAAAFGQAGTTPSAYGTFHASFATDACNTCGACGVPLQLCAPCRSVAYCCRDHQKADWKVPNPWRRPAPRVAVRYLCSSPHGR